MRATRTRIMIYFCKALEIEEFDFRAENNFHQFREKRSLPLFGSSLEGLTPTTHMANWCSSFNAQIEMLRKSFKCSRNGNSHRDVPHYINRLSLFVRQGKYRGESATREISTAECHEDEGEMSKVKSYKNRNRDLFSVISDWEKGGWRLDRDAFAKVLLQKIQANRRIYRSTGN